MNCRHRFVIGHIISIQEQEHYTYIPLSSFFILLVVILTCASRRKKSDSLSAIEHNFENDIKGDYAIMCFPCLKKKPELKDHKMTADLSDQFEYIVEKYTIRKVPLLLANTTEDIIERQEELELTQTQLSQPELMKDDFVNFKVDPDAYNIQKITPTITVAANTISPNRKTIKDKPKPSDILESMSPIPRPSVKNHNYVVIPTKGSLRNRDIMMTKREITNQYLNNFSSVFVDNLKDQVPKDPEQFPSLSRPYTSAFRNLPLSERYLSSKHIRDKKFKKGKMHKVAYSFPMEDSGSKEEASLKEEEQFYDTDSDSKDQMTEIPESDFQYENETIDYTDKSKSLVLMNDSDSYKEDVETGAYPFKMTIKSTVSEMNTSPTGNCTEYDSESNSPQPSIVRGDWLPNNNKVTYEDIQALDVGYEFTSCEKLGVKPKMTRIHYPHESERSKEVKMLSDTKVKKSFFSLDQSSVMLPTTKAFVKLKHARKSDSGSTQSAPITPNEKQSSKSVTVADASALPKIDSSVTVNEPVSEKHDAPQTKTSMDTFETKSDVSKSLNELDLKRFPMENVLENVDAQSIPESKANTKIGSNTVSVHDSVTEISKLYELEMPVKHNSLVSANCTEEAPHAIDVFLNYPMASKSRSFQDGARMGMRNESLIEAKGNDNSSTFPSKTVKSESISRVDDPETETSFSRDSKTSSSVTTPRSSERDEGKRATLRWKIVIKHHRDDKLRKNVQKNIKI